MSFRRSNFRGFTLIELVLVMVIIAIISVVVVPQLSGFSKGRKLSNEADRFLSVANWARGQAISRGVTYRLNIDENARRYWLTYMSDDGSTFANDDEQNLNFLLPEDLFIASDSKTQDGEYIEFQPSGRVTTVTIRLTNQTTGEEVDIGSLSATEILHVLNDAERQGVAL